MIHVRTRSDRKVIGFARRCDDEALESAKLEFDAMTRAARSGFRVLVATPWSGLPNRRGGGKGDLLEPSLTRTALNMWEFDNFSIPTTVE